MGQVARREPTRLHAFLAPYKLSDESLNVTKVRGTLGYEDPRSVLRVRSPETSQFTISFFHRLLTHLWPLYRGFHIIILYYQRNNYIISLFKISYHFLFSSYCTNSEKGVYMYVLIAPIHDQAAR